MYVVQVFLPLFDNEGVRFPQEKQRSVRDSLTQRFGGLTAYTHAPVEGLWQDDGTSAQHDELVIYEVMTRSLDRDWWREYRQLLEREFRQVQVLIRAYSIDVL